MECTNCGARLEVGGYCPYCQHEDYLSPGTVLEDRYQIIDIIGSGGMGCVYKAQDLRLSNVHVAIKQIRADIDDGLALDVTIKSLESEAEMLSKLRHSALPRLSNFFAVDHFWYLVMSYIEGQTLEEYLEANGPVPEPQLRKWGMELCDALDYLHSRKPPVIFRDLKPSNIMVDTRGKLHLIDFGIARHFKPDTSEDTVYFFTSGFSPPEQYGESQTDARSDIYSLGATLHYLATGHHPQLTPFKFKPISTYISVSSMFDKTVLKAVSMSPARRPASAREMKAMLAGRLKRKRARRTAKQKKPITVADVGLAVIVFALISFVILTGLVVWIGPIQDIVFRSGEFTFSGFRNISVSGFERTIREQFTIPEGGDNTENPKTFSEILEANFDAARERAAQSHENDNLNEYDKQMPVE